MADRCPRCAFPPDLCLCAEVPDIVPPCPFVVLRHMSERERLTNTARWGALALRGTQVVEHGNPAATTDGEALAPPGSVVLFPSPHAPPLTALPSRIIVPDGTWTQARRMLQRIPALRTVPRLPLSGPPPGLRLRRPGPHRRDGMSTLEAMALALAALGRPEDADRLLDLHAKGVERVMRLKGEWDLAVQRGAPRRVAGAR